MKTVVRTVARSLNSAMGVISQHFGPLGRADALFTIGEFFRERERLPRNPARSDAGIMDYFFWRKHLPWPVLAARCCDKELAKIEAVKLSPGIKVPETIVSLPLADITKGSDLKQRLKPYLGQDLIAKPSHSNGGVVFLKDDEIDYGQYLAEVRRNFFYAARERQYYELEPKLIIEEVLRTPDKTLPDDYKFFCFHGHPLLCQIDSDRFSGHKRRLYTVPEWKPVNVGYTYPLGDEHAHRPENLLQILEHCQKLSRLFDFVRVDLYLVGSQIYFGEFTFTPDAGLKRFSDDRFDRALLDVLKSRSREHLLPFVSNGDVGA